MYIYGLLNKINQKMYIGYNSTKYDIDDFKSRPQQHLIGRGGCKVIWDAIKKHDPENFMIIKLHEEPDLTKDKLKQLEKDYIKQLKTRAPNGYNLTDGGDGFTGKHTEESKKKISDKTKGIQNWGFKTEEELEIIRQHQSEAAMGRNLGKTFEEIYGEDKAKEIKNKISVSREDYITTEETCNKISESNKLYYETHPEAKERIGEFFRGKPISEEHKKNISKGSVYHNSFANKTEEEILIYKNLISENTKKAMTDPEVRQKCVISGKRTNHKRYHTNRGITNLNCDLCREEENEFNGC
jgi:group I intron endonuclease